MRFEESFIELKEAQRLAPLSEVINLDIGLYYLYTRDYRQAAKHFLKVLELFPDFYPALIHIGWAYLQMGRFVEAIDQSRTR